MYNSDLRFEYFKNKVLNLKLVCCFLVLLGFFFSPRHFNKHMDRVRILNLGQMCLLLMNVSSNCS